MVRATTETITCSGGRDPFLLLTGPLLGQVDRLALQHVQQGLAGLKDLQGASEMGTRGWGERDGEGLSTRIASMLNIPSLYTRALIQPSCKGA